jgi:hypothetical protein
LTPSKKLGGLHTPDWFRKRRQKAKESKVRERVLEPSPIRLGAFALTLVSMVSGMSLLPIFPQPLPVIIALLVAFVTYKRPLFGMPIGTPLIALGLLYHLSSLDFIVMLGEPYVREIVVFAFIFLFTALPILFRRHKDAIAINLGIIAAISLFFNQTYYLAIPLIATSAVFFKKKAILSALFYGLISMPLLMMQYLDYIWQIPREDWWVEAGSSPPIYVPLTQVFRGLAESMTQFRLYDTSKIVWSITGQITGTPVPAEHTLGEVLSHYLDSIPGIALFIVMVLGLAMFVGYAVRIFLAKTPELPSEKLLPTFTAVVATSLFFVLLAGLQNALAFRADINGTQIAIGTLATILFTAPALLINIEPKKRATTEMILTKARELLGKLKVFEDALGNVKTNIPIPISSIEGKMLVTKDRLNDIVGKTSTSYYDISESDKVFDELDKDISKQISELTIELDTSVSEYQIHVNGEYSTWTGKLKDMGLEVRTAAKLDTQKDSPLENKVEAIKGVLEDGRRFASEADREVEKVYGVLRSLYDPTLPKEGYTTTFALQKLEENAAPWISMQALFTSLNNWRKQYGAEISASVQNLEDSLASIASLSTKREKLQSILEDNFSILMADAKKAEDIKINIENKAPKVTNVLMIREVFESSSVIAKEVISIFYKELKNKEEAIEKLLPTRDYLWERNVGLMEQMTSATDMFSYDSEIGMNKALENLPKALSHLEECVETLVTYNEKKELLLNYPIAAKAIADLARHKKQILAQDLPFEHRFAEEYLKLFCSSNYGEFRFDASNLSLMKRA